MKRACSLLVLALLHFQAAAQIDETSSATIVESTTDPRFLTEWVRELPDHPTIPSPRDFLGYTIGTAAQLTHVDEIHAYMRALADASDRVQVESMGLSQEGREMLVVVIAETELLAKTADVRSDLHRLADPRGLSESEALEIQERAVPVYWLTAGLHSPELGPPEMVMELAYRLAVEEREPFSEIRRNLITLITPVLETDGRARQVEWWRRNVQGHLDYKDMPPRSSPFWGHYTFHDNNRDAIAITQPLTKNYIESYFRWLPTISLDLHESVPLLYVSTGTGPYNENVDPITVSEWHALANYEITRLTQLGLPGVWTWGFYTGWFPGYLLWVTNNHNSMGRFYETFGNGSAETMRRDLRQARYAGKKLTERQWYRSIPPEGELDWSMRNNTNFMLSGAVASLEMVAANSDMFVRNFYQKAKNAMERGRSTKPHAFALRAEQRDIAASRDVVEILHRHGIEMRRLEKSIELEELKLEKGDLLVRLDQPYGPLAKNLLSNQEFPKDVEVPPYDDVAWTLGLHMGVTVEAIDDPAALDIEGELLGRDDLGIELPELKRSAAVWAIAHEAQRELGPAAFAAAACGAKVHASLADDELKGDPFPAGSLLIESGECEDIRELLASRGLDAIALSKLPKIETREIRPPRIAMYHAWFSTQNAGWVRYSLDQSGVPFTTVDKDAVRAGALENFDVFLLPAFWGSTDLADVVSGFDRKWSPLPYTASTETPSHGQLVSSEDITGGLGFDGLAMVQRFVEGGGTMIAMSSGGVLAAGSGMAPNIQATRPSGLNSPGSFVSAKILDGDNPLSYGYPATTYVFRGNGIVYDVGNYDRHLTPLQFGFKEVGDFQLGAEVEETPELVLSGGVVNGDKLDGKPAIVTDSLGAGRVVLFSWNPMHRHLNHHDHAFVYNALLHWNHLPVPQRPAAAD